MNDVNKWEIALSRAEKKNLSYSEWIIKPEIEDLERRVTADRMGYIPSTSHSEAVGTAGLMVGYPYN
jgi:hypothetical protein